MLKIFTDGAARGNPGPAACAFAVFDNDQIIHDQPQFLGHQTNNYAEYQGLIAALDWLVSQDPQSIKIHLDSLLVVSQMNQIYKVKHPQIIPLYQQALAIQEKLKQQQFQIHIIHIPRSQNSYADSLVNQCLDKST